MKRGLMNALALVSLALCVAMGALWVRSYWWLDWFAFDTPPIGFASHYGGVCVQLGLTRHDPRGWFGVSDLDDGGSVASNLRWFGVQRLEDDRVCIGGPHAAVALAFGLTPALALWRRLRRRHQHNVCRSCGYDLRGSESATCPECGATRGNEGNRQ